jgi:hypothetical protein
VGVLLSGPVRSLIPRQKLFDNPTFLAAKLSPDGRLLSGLAPVDVWVSPSDSIVTVEPVTRTNSSQQCARQSPGRSGRASCDQAQALRAPDRFFIHAPPSKLRRYSIARCRSLISARHVRPHHPLRAFNGGGSTWRRDHRRRPACRGVIPSAPSLPRRGPAGRRSAGPLRA